MRQPIEMLGTTHPSIPDSTWTVLNVLPGGQENNGRTSLMIVNENTTVTFRIETGCNAAPTSATAGLPFAPGGIYQEDFDNTTDGYVYAYQTSGGALTSLAVKEGR
jgi:hypothetical protein